MKKIYIVFILYLTLTVSCEKEVTELTTLNGKICDYYSNEPVNNFKLHIEKQKLSLFGAPYIKIDTFWTNNFGDFSYSFYHEKSCRFELTSGNNNHYTVFENLDIEYEVANNYNIKVKPYRTIKLELINKTNQYQEYSIWQAMINRQEFRDTILYLDYIVPDENFTLFIWLFENSASINVTSIKEENFMIENVDSSYYQLEY
jgi:hypothetical protein